MDVSVALEKSYQYTNSSDVTLKNVAKWIISLKQQRTVQQNSTYFM